MNRHTSFPLRFVVAAVLLGVAFGLIGRWVLDKSFQGTPQTSTEAQLASLDGHEGPVASVAFCADGKLLATGSYDKTIKLWDLSKRELIRTLIGHNGLINSIAFSPDSHTLASAGRGIKLWNVSSGQELLTLSKDEGSSVVLYSPDGKVLATAGFNDNEVKLWDMSRFQK